MDQFPTTATGFSREELRFFKRMTTRRAAFRHTIMEILSRRVEGFQTFGMATLVCFAGLLLFLVTVV